jgi:hypothetical protein
MNLSGGSACIKYLLFIFNLVFVVSVRYYAITGHTIRRVCQMTWCMAQYCANAHFDLCVTLLKVTSLEFCFLFTT